MSESTLAAELGLSGTMAPRLGLSPVTPLSLVWRRQVVPADSLLSAVALQGGVALGKRSVSLKEGQWVKMDTDGKKVIVATDGTVGALGPVWSGGDRLDLDGGVTVLHGPAVFDTSYFDEGGSYAPGTLLKVGGSVTVQGVASQTGALAVLTISAAADVLKAVAVVEAGPFGVSSETPAGVLRVRRLVM